MRSGFSAAASRLCAAPVALFRQVRAAAALGLVLGLVPLWYALPGCSSLRRKVERLAWGALLAGFGIRIEILGHPAPSAIHAANHMSWIDISVLGRILEAGFVAKSELADWPVIGHLARELGCVFVERDRRAQARIQAGLVESRIARQRSLVIFPEGTTSIGESVGPFRSSLFEPVSRNGDFVVQPVVIDYRNRDGSRLDARRQRRVAFLDGDALLPHALAFAADGGILARVSFLPPVSGSDRKQLARASQEAVARRLADDGPPLQAATEKRAA